MADRTTTATMIPAASSSRKRARVPTTGAGDGGGGGGEGRLGELPDELLLSILSCLTTRQAVQTSVLSRRWRHLWRSTPRFDVDLAEFARPPPSSAPWLLHGRGSTDPWERLRRFTARLLMSHAAPVLGAFRLRVATPFHRRADVESWVRRWIRRRPTALELAVGPPPGRFAAFAPPSLPALTTTSSSSPSRLTRLRLRGVVLESTFAGDLRSGCPALVDMELDRCKCFFHELSSATLRSLAMESCLWMRRPSGTNGDRTVSVVAPRLAYLRLLTFGHGDCKVFRFESGDSISEVSIRGGFNLINLFRLLRMMPNVTTLRFLPALTTTSSSSPSRLTRLRLRGVVLESTFAGDLRSGCPALVDMELDRCKCFFHELSSATLRSLAMESCLWMRRPSGTNGDRTVSVVAPRLAYLRLLTFGHGDCKVFRFESGDSISEVSIRGGFNLINLFRLLRMMPNVTTLRLSGFGPTVQY
uniref:F-box domain-containing protein n=1 Tax=Oryza barthii TaxID=65489 RepID=A0A0D3FW71_9ORYZ